MNAFISSVNSSSSSKPVQATRVSAPIKGEELALGTGFKAKSFRAQDVGEVMDPLVMVDHYVMTEPTFGEHPHGGMSAVSLLFEDSEGLFHNQDSLGNDFYLQPGDLYWLSAGSGAIHNESPEADSRIHGLQVFVNLSQAHRFESPSSLLVRSKDMPVIHSDDFCVRVALGESNDTRGKTSPSTPMTILDGTIQSGRNFSHQSLDNRGLWIHAVKGNLDIAIDGKTWSINSGEALAGLLTRNSEIKISNHSSKSAHFALFDGAQINESFIQKGPFVMGSEKQISDIEAAYKAGKLGTIAKSN